ncbi:DUF5642 family protein [Mycolicibacterium arenosum]|uniref:DUF5642 family protein n=1 Tax=Mycolicibacterium arenosum TaxID=2952157 RepID=A0ABT1LYA7_9MYCO|nr:DUF5642 family protein [Mycolicibacterium sp. CAU 1645]MCP9271888.1 DUF5642 family protein [Mycolicibacterium sp. CAU 1645]
MSRTLFALACALLLAACGGGQPADVRGDIAKVVDLRSTFGPDYTLSTVEPTGIDPRLLAPQPLPQGVTLDPPDCGTFATGLTLPDGLKGNMAAVTAEGAGNRFIVIAVETSEAVTPPQPGDNCRKVAFAGPGARGLVEVADAPAIDGATTLGTHRFVQTVANGKVTGSGELYNYVASFGSYLVIVTANPLVEPNKPVLPTNTERARELLASAVALVRGS